MFRGQGARTFQAPPLETRGNLKSPPVFAYLAVAGQAIIQTGVFFKQWLHHASALHL